MVNTAFVLLPLYIYPLNNSWDIYTTSIAAHSNLEFQIIVAPDLTTVPLDPNYVSALSTLNSFSNVKTLGYVPITYAERNISDIMSDIDSYASWANYADDIGVSGIFFDQAPSTLTTHTQAYVQAITCYARGSLGSQSTQICLNPGEPVDSFFYTMADSINVYEDAWDTFNLSMMGILNWDLLARSTYLVHSFTGGVNLQDDLVSNISDSNVGGLLITTQAGYDTPSAMWSQFVSYLDGYRRE